MRRIDVSEAKQHYSYNANTGELTRISTGKVASDIDKDGYLRVSWKRKKYQAHRVAWAIHTGKDPGEMTIDHINRVKADNRIDNLRLATKREQACNVSARGIHRYRNKWRAIVRHKGKKHQHNEVCPLIARLWYEDKKRELHGVFSGLS